MSFIITIVIGIVVIIVILKKNYIYILFVLKKVNNSD